MNRRGFLAGILASGFAPAAIGSGVLMPVRAIVRPVSGLSMLMAADADRSTVFMQITRAKVRHLEQRIRDELAENERMTHRPFIVFVHPSIAYDLGFR